MRIPILSTAMDIIFPPRCLGCNERVGEQAGLCSDCFSQMHFISAPLCEICGHPFSYSESEGSVCGACSKKRPIFTKARSVFHYHEGGRKLILDFKYYDKTLATSFLATLMIQAGKEILAQTDIVIPVPLHRLRLLARKYNQAALLTGHIEKHRNIPALQDGLQRIRYTPPQNNLTWHQRARNVGGAFRLTPKYSTMLAGKHVTLIDDVMTTGATIDACCKILRQADVATVSVLTLGRTIHET